MSNHLQIRGNTVQRKSFAIPTTLSAVVPRQIVKKIFAERKREAKNAKRSLPRFARHNDARVNAFIRMRFFDYPQWLSSEEVFCP